MKGPIHGQQWRCYYLVRGTQKRHQRDGYEEHITVVEDDSSPGDVHILSRSRHTNSEEVSDDDPGVDDDPSSPYPRHANPFHQEGSKYRR